MTANPPEPTPLQYRLAAHVRLLTEREHEQSETWPLLEDASYLGCMRGEYSEEQTEN